MLQHASVLTTMEIFRHLPDYLGWTVAVVGGLTTLVVMTRKWRARAKVLADRAQAVGDVLLGRPAMVHPETGEVLLPESPGIGTRMASIEGWQAEVGPILVSLAQTQVAMLDAGRRIDRMEDSLAALIAGGARGLKGEPGRDGTRGQDGSRGKDGTRGERGDPGLTGDTGLNGQNGQNGVDRWIGDPLHDGQIDQ